MRWRDAAGSPWVQAVGLVLWLALMATWRPLTLPDEGRYVGVALEMLRSGDWVVPTLDGLPYFHKPPLFYWITAAALALGGPHLLAARAASLLAAVAMGAFVAWFAARRLGADAARWTVWMLATMPFLAGASQFANLDLLVAACITGAIVCLADGLLRDAGDAAARRVIVAGWVMMALGVLAKGLIGLVLPLAVVGAWSLQRRGWGLAWFADAKRALGWAGPVAWALIALPWFIAVQRRHPGFLDYFVVEHHLRRYASAGFNNQQPFWFYAPVIAGLTLPWFAFIGRGAQGAGTADASGTVRKLAWWWLGIVALFFSLPRSKLLGYVLPVLPALALLLADRACRVPGAWLADPRRRAGIAALAMALSMVALGAIAHHNVGRNHQALAAVLDREAAPQAPVYAFEVQPYDLPYYASVPRPIVVVAAWGDPALARHDDWRKELADAARFDPARAAQVLLDHGAALRAWCTHSPSWVIAAPDAAQREPVLRTAAPRSATKAAALWRLDRYQLAAAGLCR
ncbi:MAG: glycosyltransferase family 39 protein [Burkholderiaceae bacterium]